MTRANGLPSEQTVERWATTLDASSTLLSAAWTLKRWTVEAITRLHVGYDGDRFIFVVRDQHGALKGVVRYAPPALLDDGQPKSLADKGSKRELFPAPETISDPEIVICEGESDAVTATAAGLSAVAVPGTAGWRKEWAPRFEGRLLTISMDCDTSGRKTADEIAQDCVPWASDVRVIDLDPSRDDGYDLGDYFASAKTPDELRARRLEFLELCRHVESYELPPPSPAALTIEAVPVTSFTARPVEWLWNKRVPRGMLTLLYGMPDRGKSQLSILIAAELTHRGERVLIATAEDAIDQVVKPRLAAAGADLNFVDIVRVKRHGVEDGLTLPDDMEQIERLITPEHALLIIDPLNAHLAGTVNSFIDASMRRALAPLHRLAESTRCAILLIGHVNKGQGHDALMRVGGSIGLPGAVRSALLFANDPADLEGPSRVLAHTKCNVGLKQTPHVVYEVKPTLVELDGRKHDTARLEHTGESDVGLEALLGEQPSRAERSEIEEIAEWLRGELESAPLAAQLIYSKTRKMGWNDRAVRRAKDRLGVETDRVGFGTDGIWTWRLPDSHYNPEESPPDG